MTKIHELRNLGQSIWLDNIERPLLRNGGLQDLVDAGVAGVTSNPSIFQKAITSSPDYDEDIRLSASRGKSVTDIYEALALSDIAEAADILRPVHEGSGGVDGFVSLEVDPRLAHDAEGTFSEAVRLFTHLGQPNVMIKIPATPAGFAAIPRLMAAGVNINVTLIFSLRQYVNTIKAFMDGAQRLLESGPQVPLGMTADRIASVASIFISRTDTLLDPIVRECGREDLAGGMAVSVARRAYAVFQEMLEGPAWRALAAKGVKVQRPLWASTSTKNPEYPDTLYVDELIGPHTVNTLPPKTIDAFLERGSAAETVTKGHDEAQARLDAVEAMGVDLEKELQKLQDAGLTSFEDAFTSLLASIEEKRRSFTQDKLSA